MEPFTVALSSVSIANMIVLALIMGIFAKTYSKTKAQLPLSIMLFAGLMFLHNILFAYALFDEHLNLLLQVQALVSATSFPYMLAVSIAELGGLLVFLKISWD